ncbi:TWiK family of potassium channels protein 18 [Toxocara canis]|uniref:TWiK family of potassium channels protein 18 n=1 Tax=Toxocara canis TaxID=6265 RepID=A0A0B2UYJ8_TOXCA|nr:TWiK family of potassium channels protein 18 [Toxocara canis]
MTNVAEESSSSCDERDYKKSISKKLGKNNAAFISQHYYADGPNEGAQSDASDLTQNSNGTELSGRRKSMLRMQEYLSERGEFCCIDIEQMLAPNNQLILPHFDMHRNALRMHRPSVFQQMAKLDNKLGVRHVLLVVILSLYALFGGLIFYKLEHDNEINSLNENHIILTNFFENLTIRLFKIVNVTPTPQQHQQAMELVRDYYREMLLVEDKYAGSVFHKYENFDERLTWYFSSAIFFAMTVFTTIGYGTIACQTVAGKVVTIIYAVVGIPLMLMVVSDLGRVLLGAMTSLYNSGRHAFRQVKMMFTIKLCRRGQRTQEDEYFADKQLPLYISVLVVMIYLLICSSIISFCDSYDGMKQGLSYFDSFYYSFQSLATIGLGDVMPNNIKYNPLVSLMFIFGLALLSLVNGTVYRKVERKFLAYMDQFESWLQNLNYGVRLPEGYLVFRNLSPNIQLLALALPIFDNIEEANIHELLDPRNTKLGQRTFAERGRIRSLTMPATDLADTATLGIFATTHAKHRSATFALLALALPIFDNIEEANIHELLDPRNTKLGQRTFAERGRIRSLTMPATDLADTATLGIFATTHAKHRSATFANYHSLGSYQGRMWTTSNSIHDWRRRADLRRVVSESDEQRLIVSLFPSPQRFRAVTECF